MLLQRTAKHPPPIPPAFCLPPSNTAATYPSVLIPGLAAYTLPNFYTRWREAVVVLSKLLAAASYPSFRLSWQAPGTPLDIKAGFGSFWSRLPVHPLAVLQCGAVSMLSLSIRHSLRFRAQLLCQLAMLVVAMQAEAVSGDTWKREAGAASCPGAGCVPVGDGPAVLACGMAATLQPCARPGCPPCHRPRTERPPARSSTLCRCATPRCCSWCAARWCQ